MKKWYVVQVAPGGEEMFQRDLLTMARDQGFSELLGEVVIPTRKKNPEDLEGEKVFPGYILVNADMQPELVSFLGRIPRFSRFAGGKPPAALSDKEVRNIFDNAKKLLKKEAIGFSVGMELKIVGGPFAGFAGIVEGVEGEKQKVKLSVSIFGRMTSIVVDFDQVELQS